MKGGNTMNQIRFDDQVAIITGAGAGLGRAYAIELARRGALVVINDLNKDASNNTADEIKKNGGKAVTNNDTVSSIQGGQKIVDTAIDTFGRLDILINNAGFIRDRSIIKMTEEEWDNVYMVHLKGAFCVTKPAYIAMRNTGYGRIIMTTSGAALYGNFGQSNYTAAKMGIIGLMNGLKIESEKYNIKINAIAPVAATQLTEGVLPAEIFEKLRPEFVVPLVIYLCSRNVEESGSIFNCIGGWYSRAAIQCAPGIILRDGENPVSAEQIQQNWDSINTLEGARYLSSVIESFGFLGNILT